ncbi:hypothetical protein [Streptomyces sp. NPDC005438]|uniref:hypothetical protein n=1 Tax=Streptomyces sp. NPDC005438 TaxID=3156880 RepID=UPI0033A958ED
MNSETSVERPTGEEATLQVPPDHFRLGPGAFFRDPDFGLSMIAQGRSMVLVQDGEPLAVVRPVTEAERSYYAVLAERSERLTALSQEVLESLADRLPEARLGQLRKRHFVGEWEELVAELADTLRAERPRVTAEERERVAELLRLGDFLGRVDAANRAETVQALRTATEQVAPPREPVAAEGQPENS